jgi:helix-turn-helix protein
MPASPLTVDRNYCTTDNTSQLFLMLAGQHAFCYIRRMNEIQAAALRLKKRHLTWRAAAEASGIDYAYLYRLGSGEKSNPSPEILEKLGLRVELRRIPVERNARANT